MGILAVAWLFRAWWPAEPDDALKEKVGMIGDRKITLAEVNIASLSTRR